MSEEYKTGLRLVFGDGQKAFHGGFIEGVPALIVSTRGVGEVGGSDEFKGYLPSGEELAAFIFENIESVEAAIIELRNVRDHYIREQESVLSEWIRDEDKQE